MITVESTPEQTVRDMEMTNCLVGNKPEAGITG